MVSPPKKPTKARRKSHAMPDDSQTPVYKYHQEEADETSKLVDQSILEFHSMSDPDELAESPTSKKLGIELDQRNRTLDESGSPVVKQFIRPESHGNDSGFDPFTAPNKNHKTLLPGHITTSKPIFGPMSSDLRKDSDQWYEDPATETMPTSYQVPAATQNTTQSSYNQAIPQSPKQPSQATALTKPNKPNSISGTENATDGENERSIIYDPEAAHAADGRSQSCQEDDHNTEAKDGVLMDLDQSHVVVNEAIDLTETPPSYGSPQCSIPPAQPISGKPMEQAPPPPTQEERNRQYSASPITIRGGQSPRVTKPRAHVSKPSAVHTKQMITNSSDLPSEQDIFCMLMLSIEKSKAEKENVIARARAKVKTLQHHYSQLRIKNEELETKVRTTEDSGRASQENQDKLQSEIDLLKTRYRKIHDYAQDVQSDLIALRESANVQQKQCQSLLQEEHARQQSMQELKDSVQQDLDRSKDEVAELRIKAAQLSSENTFTKQELQNRSAELSRQQRRNNRLEDHIQNLENTQQRFDKATTSNHQKIYESLSELLRRISGIESTVLARPEDSEKFQHCLTDIKALQSGTVTTQDELKSISDKIDGLKDTIRTGVESVNGLIVSSQSSDTQESIMDTITRLEASITSFAPTDAAYHAEREWRIEAVASTNAMKERIHDLIKARDDAQSYAAAFEKRVNLIPHDGPEKLKETKAKLQDANEKYSRLTLRLTTARSTILKLLRGFKKTTMAIEGLTVVVGYFESQRDNSLARDAALEKELQDATELNRQQLDQINKSEVQIQDHEKEVEQLRSQHENLETKFRGLKRDSETNEKLLAATRESLTNKESAENVLGSKLAEVRAQCEVQQQELDSLRDVSAELASIKQQYQAALADLKKLEADSMELDAGKTKFAKLTEESLKKDRDIETLRKDLESAQVDQARMSQFQEEIKNLAAEKANLESDLNASLVEAHDVSILQSEASTKDAVISDLRTELSQANSTVQSLQRSTAEDLRLREDLERTKKDLEHMQRELASKTELEIQLRQANSEVSRLQQQLTRHAHPSADLRPRQDESQRKDFPMASPLRPSDMTTIQDQQIRTDSRRSLDLVAAKVESQEGIPIHLSEALVSDLEFLPEDTYAQRNNAVEIENSDPILAQRPQRRAADRSGTRRAVARVLMKNLPATQTSSSGRTDIVPDSQELLRRERSVEGPTQQAISDKSSELSEEDIIEDDLSEDGASQPKANTHQEVMTRRGGNGQAEMSTHGHSSSGRPSSSMSIDLFRQHASSLSVPAENVRREVGSPLPALTQSQDLEIPETIDPTLLQNPSPRRLRDGTQFGARELTPLPEPIAEPSNITTPHHVRERHRPNSAIKRRAQGDTEGISNSSLNKRLKRKPENLQIRSRARSSSFSTPDTEASAALPTSSRVRGSGMSSNATSSQKTSKVGKASRKNSKKTKYDARFNA